ncbi:MAG: SMC-Scp complex subunit ScpB [Candidatus Woesearchaeota archaeon]
MSDLKFRIESILFSAGQKISIEDISRLTKERDLERIKQALEELKQEFEQKGGSLMLVQEGDFWKMTVREKYLPFVRKIVTQTELPKSVIETLAVVAFKAPVLQSKIISIRTNKAYKHLDLLEEDGYITREKKGRTKLIKLTKTFFEYFDLPPEELKKKFEGFKELEQALEKKEEQYEAETIRAAEVIEESKGVKEPGVELVTQSGEIKKLEVYTEEPKTEVFEREEIPPPLEPAEDKLGELEIYGEKEEKETPKKKHKKKEKKEKQVSEEFEEGPEKIPEETEEITEGKEEEKEIKKEPEEARLTVEKIEEEASRTKVKQKKYESEGIFKGEIPAELEKKISERAEEIVHGEKEEKVEEEENPELPEPEEEVPTEEAEETNAEIKEESKETTEETEEPAEEEQEESEETNEEESEK